METPVINSKIIYDYEENTHPVLHELLAAALPLEVCNEPLQQIDRVPGYQPSSHPVGGSQQPSRLAGGRRHRQ